MENTYLNKLILPLCDKGASISMLCQAARNGLMQILFVSRMILGGGNGSLPPQPREHRLLFKHMG